MEEKREPKKSNSRVQALAILVGKITLCVSDSFERRQDDENKEPEN